jgi:hypothetical protein
LEARSYKELVKLIAANRIAVDSLPDEKGKSIRLRPLNSHLGQLYVLRGQPKEGLRLLEAAYKPHLDDAEAAWAVVNLATSYATLNHFDKATKLLLEARGVLEKWWGEWPEEII